jgi:hypothetical protein
MNFHFQFDKLMISNKLLFFDTDRDFLVQLKKQKIEFHKEWLEERLQEAVLDDKRGVNLDLNRISVVSHSTSTTKSHLHSESIK